MQVRAFFDPATYTLTYLVFDETSRQAAIIDPVLDYDPGSAKTALDSAQAVIAAVRSEGLDVRWILETHAHADHLSAAPLLADELGAKTAIGEHIVAVQRTFKSVFDLPESFPTDGSQFDRLLADGDTLALGASTIGVVHTPGHTPACVSYRVDDMVFTGDALFMDDYGTGRCDFPAGSSADLYTSIQKLYALPDETRVFVGHDYQPGGRELRYETTIGRSKANNPHLRADTRREDFVRTRDERDATLAAPKLLFPSVQVNIDGGRLPAANEAGQRFLKIPLNLGMRTDDAGRVVV